MSPNMIRSMEILQLNSMALQERLDQELEDNPLLDDDNSEDDISSDEANERSIDNDADTEIDHEKEMVVEDNDNNEDDFERLVEMASEWPDDNVTTAGSPSSNSMSDVRERQDDMMANAVGHPQSIQESLVEQLGFFDLPKVIRDFAEYLIYNMDDDGRLQTNLPEMVQVFPVELSLDDAELALHTVQKLDPPGIGARDLKECWLLQIPPKHPMRDVLMTLISSHLEDLAHRRLPQIQRKTGYSVETIKDAIEEMKAFNPFPGRSRESEPVQKVTADMVVEKNEDGKYVVELLDEYIPTLRISPKYAEMLKNGADDGTREFIKNKLDSAKWLIEAIEQRFSTMKKVAQTIVDFQTNFLDDGPEYIQPLKMQQIADVVGVHVTTVSRAVNDKWIQTPRGLFSLKRFFGGGTQTSDGEEVALDIVRLKLKEIIANEDKDSPLSDDALVNELIKQGYPLARRTVTKYRKMMSIPSSRHRKSF